MGMNRRDDDGDVPKQTNIEVNVGTNDKSTTENSSRSHTEFNTTNPNNGVQEEHWFKSHWRPAAAWTYLGICIFDFVLAPTFMGWFAWYTVSKTISTWVPLTLQGGGLFHIAYGAIIGVTAWGRTKEKLAGSEDVTTRSKD